MQCSNYWFFFPSLNLVSANVTSLVYPPRVFFTINSALKASASRFLFMPGFHPEAIKCIRVFQGLPGFCSPFIPEVCSPPVQYHLEVKINFSLQGGIKMVKTGIREGRIQARRQILPISSFLPDLSLVPGEFYVGTDLWGKSIMGRERPVLKVSVWGSNRSRNKQGVQSSWL